MLGFKLIRVNKRDLKQFHKPESNTIFAQILGVKSF